MDQPALAARVRTFVDSHPAVRAVFLVGSRERGDATKWSDWDFRVRTDDFASVASALPSLVGPSRPLAAQWDRLSDQQCYMLILDGPQKVDLLFDEPHEHELSHVVSAGTLPAIDAHFWDWTLWLTSKVAAAKDDVVRAELAKMAEHLLAPLGLAEPPPTLTDAVDAYVSARTHHERRLGIQTPRELGRQVSRVIDEQAAKLA